jgi:hypothetical protein
LGIDAHTVQAAEVTLLAEIRVDNVVATVVGLEASKRASVGTKVGAIQLAEVALFWAVDYAIPAERPPRAFRRASAVSVVAIRARAARRNWNRSITAVTLFSRFDNAITTLTTLVTAPVAANASVELVTTNPGAGLPRHATLPSGFNRLAVFRTAVTAGRVPVVTCLVGGQNSVPASGQAHACLPWNWLTLELTGGAAPVTILGVAVITLLTWVKYAISTGAHRSPIYTNTRGMRIQTCV